MVIAARPRSPSVVARRGALPLVVIGLGGCVANPDYVPPVVEASASEGESESEGEATTLTSESTSTTAGTSTDTSQSATGTSSGGVCGDGELDPGEACDEGPMNGAPGSTCAADCTLYDGVCGDGALDPGEACDDGNNDDGDGCSSVCAEERPMIVCGDGKLGGDELCDDGNQIEGDGCEPDCTPTPGVCGDGVVDFDELCDDGNNTPGDGCEPDCTPSQPAQCIEPAMLPPCDFGLDKGDNLAAFKAMGLGCSGNNLDAILITKPLFAPQDVTSWEFAHTFGLGEYYLAREGFASLMLSTGHLAKPDPSGKVTLGYNSQVTEDANANLDDDSFLPGFVPGDDQSGTLPPVWAKGGGNPNDKIFLSFSTVVPEGASAYSVDFAVFSSEWPQFVDTQFDDIFVIWEVSESFTGNVAVVDGQAITSTSLHPHWSSSKIDVNKDCESFLIDRPGFSCDESELSGTGFEGHAATTWLRLNHPAVAGSEITLYFFLADMTDSQSSTVVMLDRFRFLCMPCIVAADPKCKGVDPDLNCCGISLPQ